MKQIKILVSFKDNEMIFPNIEFVKNDYNHVEFIFDFDEDDGKKVFELKKPNGKVFIKEIIDNKVLLSDFDEKGNIIPVINQSGLYEFEITKYKSDSKFTISKVCQFMARDEIVNIDDDIVDKDASLPILNDLITTTIALKENTEKIGQLVKEKGDYAEEQGNYAKEVASNVINANNQATKLINNFESNVKEYTSDFNKKATTKQEKFDSNSTTKINEYNDNATSKLKQYNDNHESKLKDYNDNASEKTKAFNSNSLLKTTAYDKNADDKLSAYNTNCATKLDEYNDNATLKAEEYNTNASSKIEEYNSNATQKLEEYDEHSEELNNKINSTNSELEKLKDEILEIGEVSDSYIHLEDSTMSKLKSLSIEGICQQETTTGKNLYNAKEIYNWKGTVGWKFIDGSINAVGTNLGNNTSLKAYVEKGKTYTFSVNTICITPSSKATTALRLVYGDETLISNIREGKYTYTFTATQTNSVLMRVYLNEKNTTVTISNIQLEKSSIATNYELYTGCRPSPSHDYPQEIKTITGNLNLTSCNKNLLKMNDNYSKGYTTTKNGITLKVEDDLSISLKGTATNKTEFFLLGSWGVRNNSYIPKGIFTISQNGFVDGITSNLGFFKNGVNVQNQGLTYTKTSNIFNLSLIEFDGISYAITIDEGKTIDTRVYIQLESSKKTTPFEQHIQSQITANLGTEFIGKINDTYKDTLSIDLQKDGLYHLMLNKLVGKRILNSGDMSSRIVLNTGDIMYRTMKFRDISINKVFIILCNRYVGIEKPANRKDGNIYWNSINMTIDVIDNRTSITTIDEFKTWLSTHDIEVYYVLEEPYKIDLGIVDMPFSFEKVTNIFTDSDLLPKINATYYKNFISTIKNLKVNNETLKNELVSINNRLSTLENDNVSVVNDDVIEESEVVNNE